MKLRPEHGCLELSELRQMAATKHGRTRLQNLLTEYLARRGGMVPRDRSTHDIAAARVRFALSETRASASAACVGGPRFGGTAA